MHCCRFHRQAAAKPLMTPTPLLCSIVCRLTGNKGYVAEFGADGIAATPSYPPFYTAAPLSLVNARAINHHTCPTSYPLYACAQLSPISDSTRSTTALTIHVEKTNDRFELSPLSAEGETCQDRFAIDITQCAASSPRVIRARVGGGDALAYA